MWCGPSHWRHDADREHCQISMASPTRLDTSFDNLRDLDVVFLCVLRCCLMIVWRVRKNRLCRPVSETSLRFRNSLDDIKAPIPVNGEVVEPPRSLHDVLGPHGKPSFTTVSTTAHEAGLREDRQVLGHSLASDAQTGGELRRGGGASFSEIIEKRSTRRVIERTEDVFDDGHCADMMGVKSRPSA